MFMSSRTSRRSKRSDAPARRISKYGTRLRLGSYIADIVSDGDKKPFIHHCIVQQIGSPQVLYLGQEDTFDAARESGHRLCNDWLRRTGRRQTQSMNLPPWRP